VLRASQAVLLARALVTEAGSAVLGEVERTGDLRHFGDLTEDDAAFIRAALENPRFPSAVSPARFTPTTHAESR
jgi:hypothetical protein